MNVYEEFTKKYGDRPQMIKTMEACGELIPALCKYLIETSPDIVANKYDPDTCRENIIREAVQVEIMINQLRFVISDLDLWYAIRAEEVERLWAILERDGVIRPE